MVQLRVLVGLLAVLVIDGVTCPRKVQAEEPVPPGSRIEGTVRSLRPGSTATVELIQHEGAHLEHGWLGFLAARGNAFAFDQMPSWFPAQSGGGVARDVRQLEANASSYRFEGLPPGLYEVRARPRSGAVGSTFVHVQAAGQRARCDVHLPPGGESLEVLVTDAAGQPRAASGACIPMWAAHRGKLSPWPEQAQTLALDDQGRGRFNDLVPGAYQVRVRAGGLVRFLQDVSVPRADPLGVVIGSPATRRVQVVDGVTGERVPGVEAIAVSSSPDGVVVALERLVGGDDGTVVVPLHGPRTRLGCRAEGRAVGWIDLPPDREQVEMALDPTCSVWGRVLDVEGRPVAGGLSLQGALVEITLPTYPDRVLRAATDAAGAFRVPGMPGAARARVDGDRGRARGERGPGPVLRPVGRHLRRARRTTGAGPGSPT